MADRKMIIPVIAVLFAGIFIGLSIDASAQSAPIPSWIKNTALWWAQDQISDDEFITALQYLVGQGILKIPVSADPIENEAKETASAEPDPVEKANVSDTHVIEVAFFEKKGTDCKIHWEGQGTKTCFNPNSIHVKRGDMITINNIGDISLVIGTSGVDRNQHFSEAGGLVCPKLDDRTLISSDYTRTGFGFMLSSGGTVSLSIDTSSKGFCYLGFGSALPHLFVQIIVE